MRYASKPNLCLGAAAGAAFWATVFVLPACPRVMPLGAFEAVAEADGRPSFTWPDDVPAPRNEGPDLGGCLAAKLPVALGEVSGAQITSTSVALYGSAHPRFAKHPCGASSPQTSP
jgi:hypothetical protein